MATKSPKASTAKSGERPKSGKAPRSKPVSLHPLSFDEVMERLVKPRAKGAT